MDNFHFGLVNCVGNHENLLNLLFVVESFVFVKKTVLTIWAKRFRCLWSILIIIFLFCKIISRECSLFLSRFYHWSKWLIAHMWVSWLNGAFNRRL